MIGIALFAVTVGCIAFSFGGANKMPYYEGKSLQEWFDLFQPHHSEEDPDVKAIIAIGSEAVPFLLHELCVSESPWAERSRRLQCKLGLVRRPYSTASSRNYRAYNCLLLLGTNADSALPELIKVARDEAHPSLAIGLLGFNRSSPTTIVPVLEKRIANPPNPRAPGPFMAAISSLATQGTNAHSALPRLKEIEGDARIPLQIRIEAACARLSIDPANPQPLDFIVGQWESTNDSRRWIIQAFRFLGTNAIPALPAMRRMSQNGSDTYESFALRGSMRWLETLSGTELSSTNETICVQDLIRP